MFGGVGGEEPRGFSLSQSTQPSHGPVFQEFARNCEVTRQAVSRPSPSRYEQAWRARSQEVSDDIMTLPDSGGCEP